VKFILCTFFIILGTGLNAQQLSKSFEFRYFTNDTKANGETDFHGETEIFNTDQRIEFLHQYGNYAKEFFNDPELNTKVVSDKEVENFLARLKQAPVPSVRKRIIPETWKWLGFNSNRSADKISELEKWKTIKGVEIIDHALVFSGSKTVFERKIQEQTWRFKLQFDIKIQSADNNFSLALLSGERSVARVGIDNVNRFFYMSKGKMIQTGKCSADCWHTFELEVDLLENRYNLYIDQVLQADFVTLGADTVHSIGSFVVEANKGVSLGNLYGVSYIPTKIDLIPYIIHTFIDENFMVGPQITGWNTSEYDDSKWEETKLPKVHGGDRFAGEDLYLRRKIMVGKFERAVLNFETLDPGGEIWVNGKVVAVITNRYPVKVDLSEYLKPDTENLIAVRVKSSVADVPLEHAGGGDPNIGWFAGRMFLDITKLNYIDEVLAYAVDVKDSAKMRHRIMVVNKSKKDFEGIVQVRYYKWFPDESPNIASEEEYQVQINASSRVEIDRILSIKDPVLWTHDHPTLYKVEVLLKDKAGNDLDDYVFTTGIRTISQDGGTFRVNGKPEMLNGAQIFGCRMPPDHIAMWNRCAPASELAKEILEVKKMNGNMLRVHVHSEKYKTDGINDPRLPEMCDQLGIMLIWQTPAWIRNGSFWNVDFEGYAKYMRQVYNYPSIVMWEVTNHPWPSSKPYSVEETNRIFERVYNTIYPLDPSRLISPASFYKVFSIGNDAGTIDNNGNPVKTVDAYRAPMITRGNQDSFTGYGRKWSELRKLPDSYVYDFLNSPDRAYFNFEHEESIGQPNWSLAKGKPWYKLQSYEWDYDVGSIGRKLQAEEWLESQAWQAFSAWESMKKQRLIGYDGFSWCCLHGGPNMGTYKKPLIDELGNAKISYYVNKMIFQRTVAGSDNVDVVYGPGDSIRPIIMNLDNSKTVDLTITVKSVDGKVIDKKEYRSITLPAGRTTTHLDAFKPDVKAGGAYAIEYIISNIKSEN
jgi:hypothetical protein